MKALSGIAKENWRATNTDT